MPFKNCSEAYTAGRANIPKGDPAYARKLDRDDDGLACDKPPAGFVARPQKEASAGVKVETGAGTGQQLPKTGPAAELGAAGAVLLTAGMVAAVLFRRRRTRFVA